MRRVIVFMLILMPLLTMGEEVFAERSSSFEEGPIIRRKLLLRAGRFEMAPVVGFTMNDPFKRNTFFGVGLAYHITNEFSLSLGFGYNLITTDSNILDEMKTTVPDEASKIEFGAPKIFFDFCVGYVPVLGKFSILGFVMNYDFHVALGIAGFTQSGEIQNIEERVGEGIDGFKFGPVVGFGFRLFLLDWFALNLEGKYYFVELSTFKGSESEDGSYNFMFNIGLSFFLPTEVKISK